MNQRREYSEDTARRVDDEVTRMLGDAYTKAKEVLKGHLEVLHSMAAALLEREVLDGNEIDEIIRSNGGTVPPAGAAAPA